MNDVTKISNCLFPRHLDRRAFLSRASALACSPLILGGQSAHAEGFETGKSVVVRTTYGQLRGIGENGVLSFKGISYAGPSEGENRFKPPTKLQSWTGVRDAVAYGARAIQNSNGNGPAAGDPMSENCQFLNVWTPGEPNGRKLPVMFYIHGGGFMSGSGGSGKNLNQDGSALCRNNDVVVVTSNHRLGLMGYLYLAELGGDYPASGDNGMLDIVASLEWVRDNIAAFGGDPGNVTIWGESGGGEKIFTLLAMPSAKGLFHKASIESAPNLNMGYREQATETAKLVLADLGLSAGQVRELAKVPVARLVQAQQAVGRKTDGRAGTVGWFGPVVDGKYLPAHPYEPVAPAISKNIPMIIGSNMQETIFQLRTQPEAFSLDEAGLRARLQIRFGDKADLFLNTYRKGRPEASPTDIYIAITTHQWMWIDSVRRAERQLALKGAPVFMYLFDYESEAPVSNQIAYPRKAMHANEIPFKFDHPENDPGTGKKEARFQAAKNMSRAWAAFARTGNPSHSGIPKWPAYSLEQRATMILDSESKVINDPMREERLVWQQAVDKIGMRP